ncbi:hypothetical protein HMI54_004719 [Coelomomyces lativittatus]|nr:hypothetical protein HMI54_004719 [Coelomomyces lativittatus]
MRNGVSVLIPEWGLECPLVLSTTTWQYQSKAGYLQHHTLTSIQLHVFTKVELNVCVSDEGDEASEASWQGVQITLGSMISDPLLGVQHILLSSNETTESCVPQKRKQ